VNVSPAAALRLLKNQPLILDASEALEAQKRLADSSITTDLLTMGTTSKLKINERKLSKAWEGRPTLLLKKTKCKLT